MRLSDQQFNRQLLLKRLRDNEPVARGDLVELTGLAGATVTAITADLLRRDLILEEKVPAKTPGRPRVNLRINANSKFVAGSTITSEGELVVEIVNLRGESVFRRTTQAMATTSLGDLAQQFASAVDEALEKSPVPRAAVTHVGVGLPGVVDNRSGVVEHIVSFEPGPWDFAASVSAVTGIPTSVDNNISLLARAEHWFGDGGDDFTLILLDLGIGAAVYQGGQLITGAHGIEPEFGHVRIVPDTGRSCVCGGRGCLQAYSSIGAIVEQCCEVSGLPIPGYLEMRERFDELLQRLSSGDEEIRPVFERSAHYLGIGLANLINMQDPQSIILLSPFPDRPDGIARIFSKALEENTVVALRNRAHIQFKHQDFGIYARGAAAMVLERVYTAQ